MFVDTNSLPNRENFTCNQIMVLIAHLQLKKTKQNPNHGGTAVENSCLTFSVLLQQLFCSKIIFTLLFTQRGSLYNFFCRRYCSFTTYLKLLKEPNNWLARASLSSWAPWTSTIQYTSVIYSAILNKSYNFPHPLIPGGLERCILLRMALLECWTEL